MEIKDKPRSMSVREWITKKIALGTVISEKIIRQVIIHQFDSAYEALDKYNSLEISGFGKFYYNTKKADREIEWCISQRDVCKELLNDSATIEKKRCKAEIKLEQINRKLNNLIKKRDYGKTTKSEDSGIEID